MYQPQVRRHLFLHLTHPTTFFTFFLHSQIKYFADVKNGKGDDLKGSIPLTSSTRITQSGKELTIKGRERSWVLIADSSAVAAQWLQALLASGRRPSASVSTRGGSDASLLNAARGAKKSVSAATAAEATSSDSGRHPSTSGGASRPTMSGAKKSSTTAAVPTAAAATASDSATSAAGPSHSTGSTNGSAAAVTHTNGDQSAGGSDSKRNSMVEPGDEPDSPLDLRFPGKLAGSAEESLFALVRGSKTRALKLHRHASSSGDAGPPLDTFVFVPGAKANISKGRLALVCHVCHVV